MTGARIEGGVTWGNVISIGTTIAAVVWAWASMNASQLETAREVKRIEVSATEADTKLRSDHEKQMVDIRADLVQHRRSIQALEISDARNSERYEAISRSLEEVKVLLRQGHGASSP